MNLGAIGRLALVAAAGTLCGAFSGCVVGPGNGYVDGGGVGIDYYEPVGVVYGGWGPGYAVGPDRGGGRGPGGAGPRAYRSAPAGRGVPSIPAGHGGGSRGGGGGRR